MSLQNPRSTSEGVNVEATTALIFIYSNLRSHWQCFCTSMLKYSLVHQHSPHHLDLQRRTNHTEGTVVRFSQPEKNAPEIEQRIAPSWTTRRAHVFSISAGLSWRAAGAPSSLPPLLPLSVGPLSSALAEPRELSQMDLYVDLQNDNM